MATNEFFPNRPETTPTIYAFAVKNPDHAGLLKIGYTEGTAKDRVAQQFPGGFDGYDIKLIEPAMRADDAKRLDRAKMGECSVEREAREMELAYV